MTAINEFIIIEEITSATTLFSPLFARKFHLPAPEFPHHIVASWRNPDGQLEPACYIHFTDCGDLMLGGGACTDERVLRRMDARQRALVREAGGLYGYTLRWSVRYFKERCAAIFGYCGDALAERVDRAVGFESTSHEKLLVCWTREIEPDQKRQIVAKANSFVPF